MLLRPRRPQVLWCRARRCTNSRFFPATLLQLLLQDDREKKWRIQAVGVAPGSFDSRKALPAPWRGLRDAELRWGAREGGAGCWCMGQRNWVQHQQQDCL